MFFYDLLEHLNRYYHSPFPPDPAGQGPGELKDDLASLQKAQDVLDAGVGDIAGEARDLLEHPVVEEGDQVARLVDQLRDDQGVGRATYVG